MCFAEVPSLPAPASRPRLGHQVVMDRFEGPSLDLNLGGPPISLPRGDYVWGGVGKAGKGTHNGPAFLGFLVGSLPGPRTG